MNPQTQFMLVSEQAAANLLPALDPEIKPREAVLVVSGKMRSRADDLEAVLKEAGVATSRVNLDNEHDFGALQQVLLECAGSRAGQAHALNVTGGTKLMALAAQSVAAAADWRVFYVDVDTDEVIWLHKHGHRQRLGQHLRLRHYLRGYGFTIEASRDQYKSRPGHDELIETLLTRIRSIQRALGHVNWLAQQAESEGTLHAALTDNQRNDQELLLSLKTFEDAGVLAVHSRSVCFTSEEDRDFAKGGWLESYVYRMVCAVSNTSGIRDKRVNLTVKDQQGVQNELDIAFMARNRLFLIECKTSRMDGPVMQKANDALFKLSELCRRVGGLGTRGMLVSYRTLRKPEKRLARALHLEVVQGSELQELKTRIRRWVEI